MSNKTSEPAFEKLEDRIESLEMKLAYQEETIQTLSDELYQQQKEVERVIAQNRQLTDKLQEVQDSFPASAGHEVPPHY